MVKVTTIVVIVGTVSVEAELGKMEIVEVITVGTTSVLVQTIVLLTG